MPLPANERPAQPKSASPYEQGARGGSYYLKEPPIRLFLSIWLRLFGLNRLLRLLLIAINQEFVLVCDGFFGFFQTHPEDIGIAPAKTERLNFATLSTHG